MQFWSQPVAIDQAVVRISGGRCDRAYRGTAACAGPRSVGARRCCRPPHPGPAQAAPAAPAVGPEFVVRVQIAEGRATRRGERHVARIALATAARAGGHLLQPVVADPGPLQHGQVVDTVVRGDDRLRRRVGLRDQTAHRPGQGCLGAIRRNDHADDRRSDMASHASALSRCWIGDLPLLPTLSIEGSSPGRSKPRPRAGQVCRSLLPENYIGCQSARAASRVAFSPQGSVRPSPARLQGPPERPLAPRSLQATDRTGQLERGPDRALGVVLKGAEQPGQRRPIGCRSRRRTAHWESRLSDRDRKPARRIRRRTVAPRGSPPGTGYAGYAASRSSDQVRDLSRTLPW